MSADKSNNVPDKVGYWWRLGEPVLVHVTERNTDLKWRDNYGQWHLVRGTEELWRGPCMFLSDIEKSVVAKCQKCVEPESPNMEGWLSPEDVEKVLAARSIPASGSRSNRRRI